MSEMLPGVLAVLLSAVLLMGFPALPDILTR